MKTADIRMTQYKLDIRIPKANSTNNLANIFGISTIAITVSDIYSYNNLIHTPFTLEDLYCFRIDKHDHELCIYPIKVWKQTILYIDMYSAWKKQTKNL